LLIGLIPSGDCGGRAIKAKIAHDHNEPRDHYKSGDAGKHYGSQMMSNSAAHVPSSLLGTSPATHVVGKPSKSSRTPPGIAGHQSRLFFAFPRFRSNLLQRLDEV
jgi:hypothetical protein